MERRLPAGMAGLVCMQQPMRSAPTRHARWRSRGYGENP